MNTAKPDPPYLDAATRAYARKENISTDRIRGRSGPELRYGRGDRLITRADVDAAVKERRNSTKIQTLHDPIPGRVGNRPSLKVQLISIASQRQGQKHPGQRRRVR